MIDKDFYKLISKELNKEMKNYSDEDAYVYFSPLLLIAKQDFNSSVLNQYLQNIPDAHSKDSVKNWIQEKRHSKEYLDLVLLRQKQIKEINRTEEFFKLPYPAVWNKETNKFIKVKDGEHWNTILECVIKHFGQETVNDPRNVSIIDKWISDTIVIKGAYFDAEMYSLAVHNSQSYLYKKNKRTEVHYG